VDGSMCNRRPRMRRPHGEANGKEKLVVLLTDVQILWLAEHEHGREVAVGRDHRRVPMCDERKAVS
jgi:hypothetical protein